MDSGSRWKDSDIVNGIAEVEISSWEHFHDYLLDEWFEYGAYAWRGQSNSAWALLSTLDRALIGKSESQIALIANRHLSRFKMASRGRRGANPPLIKDENDWWALGQHFGLKTPLLDWTTSPFVAAYFAFIAPSSDLVSQRAIFAIGQSGVKKKSNEIKTAYAGSGRPPIIEFVTPFSDENPRLVNQGGLFTRCPYGVDVESWIKANFKGEDTKYRLLKLTIPDSDRELCLRSLNRMNINHLTLFPDLYGSSIFTNLDLEIKDY